MLENTISAAAVLFVDVRLLVFLGPRLRDLELTVRDLLQVHLEGKVPALEVVLLAPERSLRDYPIKKERGNSLAPRQPVLQDLEVTVLEVNPDDRAAVAGRRMPILLDRRSRLIAVS